MNIKEGKQAEGFSICQIMEFYEATTFIKNVVCVLKDSKVLGLNDEL